MTTQISHSIYFVVGPTASGKSSFALELARKLNAAIANSDSLQIYSGLDIGTAKPSLKERSELPHYLFDIVPLGHTFTAGDYRRAALEVIEKQIAKQDLVFVGGSGFYIQALDKGMNEVLPVPPEIIMSLDESEKENGLLHLWHQLDQSDPESAAKIHPNDGYRIKRALSVIMTSGKKWSAQQARTKDDQHLSSRYSIKKIGIKWERSELQARVELRTRDMLDNGLIEEVQTLVQKGFENWAPLQSVGYKETLDFLAGRISEKELFELIVQSTMQLAKKQMTWFKRDAEIKWYDGQIGPEKILAKYLSDSLA